MKKVLLRKFAAFLFAAALLLGCAACGGQAGPDAPQTGSPSDSQPGSPSDSPSDSEEIPYQTNSGVPSDQEGGLYENGGLRLDIPPEYDALLTVKTPENDASGILFALAETASLEAAGGQDGAGELVSIARVSEARLHEILCADMSGVSVFAKDGDGNYCLSYYPTDVRYERATVEEMVQDQDQWTMLTQWADGVPEQIIQQNEGLQSFYRGNTMLDLYLARAAYQDGVNYFISSLEYGALEPDGVDGAPYAEYLLDGAFSVTDRDDAPDGEYVILAFPEEDIRFDFFLGEGNVVRQTAGDTVIFYEAPLYDEDMTFAGVMEDWYYALAEKAGVREPDAA